MSNNFVVLVTGTASSGKSFSLMNMPNPEGIVYLNSDLKEIPFKNPNGDMKIVKIIDAYQVTNGIAEIEKMEDVHTAVIDTITHLMGQYETQYVINSANTQKAWGEYGAFYKTLIHNVKAGTKNYVIFTHEADKLNEKEMVLETKAPIKGAVGRVGIEADFSIILSAKRMLLTQLEDWENDLLVVTDDEKEDGFKYVFCTRITKETIGEKTRSPMGLWSRQEKYIDNNMAKVFERIHQYYQ